MKITAEPRSDQWNADDFGGGPRDFTIAKVHPGKAEQKYDIELVGEPRAWRPPLTVLRLLIAAWGDDAESWVGQRVRLYRDESVVFGNDRTGGIRVSHMTGLPDGKPFETRVQTKRGRRAPIKVEPLKDEPARQQHPEPTAEQVAACTSQDDLRAMWKISGPERQAQIKSRVDELKAAPADDEPGHLFPQGDEATS